MGSESKLFDEIKISEDQWHLFIESGFCYLNMGRFREAGEVFQGLISIDPTKDIGHIGLGNVYFAQNRLDDAEKEQEEAIKINPNSALARAHHGEVLLFRREKEKALEELNEAIKLDPEGFSGAFARSLLEGVELGVFD